MAATTQDYRSLSKAICDAVDAFNSADQPPQLDGLLDQNVFYTKIRSPHDKVSGKQAVKAGLIARAADAVHENMQPLILTGPISIDPNSGVVSGTANWNRPSTAGLPSTKITFRFEFAQNAPNQWVLTKMSGQ